MMDLTHFTRWQARRALSWAAVAWIVCWSAAACGGRVITGSTPMPQSLAVVLPSPTSQLAVTPAPLTPAPTNTPAPTPTPIVHIVQPGDTLLGVALQYNVTLDELQQANGVLKPETLQIGQQLIIPVRGAASTGAGNGNGVPAPTAPPLPIVVQNAARYQTPVGSIWILGEVRNPTDQPIENVQVRVALLEATGQEAANATRFIVLDAVPVGGRVPFGVLFENPPAGAADFQAYVVRADPSYNHAARYAQLQIADVQMGQTGSQYHVTGSITNTGSTNAANTQLVVTLYAADGKVTGFRQFSIPDEQLPAGGKATFDVMLSPDLSAPVVTSASVVAQARVK